MSYILRWGQAHACGTLPVHPSSVVLPTSQGQEFLQLSCLALLNMAQSTVISCGIAAGLAVCIQGVAQGNLTVGDVVLFLTIMTQLYTPLSSFQSYYCQVRCFSAINYFHGPSRRILMRMCLQRGKTSCDYSQSSVCKCGGATHLSAHYVKVELISQKFKMPILCVSSQVQKGFINMENMFELLAKRSGVQDKAGAPPLCITQGATCETLILPACCSAPGSRDLPNIISAPEWWGNSCHLGIQPS